MYNIVIIENEVDLGELLKKLLIRFCKEYISSVEVANTFDSGIDLLANGDVDILMLDIELDNERTGFELLQQIENHDFHLVIVTSHSGHALQSIKASAIDFLLKPVSPEDLIQTFQRINQQSISQNKFLLEQINVLKRNIISKEPNKIVLRTSEFIQIVTIKNIIRCEASSNYTTFYLSDGEKILISKTLKEFESILLDNNFFRSHKSHMINMTHFLRFDKREGGSIIMNDLSTVPLSIRKRELFLDHLSSI